MTSDHATPPLEALLAHREWVRSLARRLTDNAVDADDLEQDAWLAAASARPRNGVGIRAWFARVMRNRAAERYRLDSNRGAREAVVARPLGLRSGAALVVDAEAHTRVVQAVLALKEPYRESVLLRFYEGLPPREVAAQMGVPVDTVKTRLRRAAEMLREALGGRREDWLGAVAPLLVARHDAPGTATAVAGGIAMKATTKAAIAVAFLIAATAAAVWSLPRGAAVAPAAISESREVAADDSSERGGALRPRRRASRADAEAAAQAPVVPETPTEPQRPRSSQQSAGVGRVVGRVLLPDGTPAVGAAVGGPGAGGWVATDADGRYSVALRQREDGASQPLWVLLPGYRAAGVGTFEVADGVDQAAPDVRLALDGTVTIRGRVVSRAGRDISSGTVTAGVVTDGNQMETIRRSSDPGPLLMLRAAWPGKNSPAALRDFEASCRAQVGAGGAFEMHVPASIGDCTLSADIAGHAPKWIPARSLAEWAANAVEIVVDPTATIRGTVVDGVTGAPVEGAVVGEQWDAASSKTGPTGTFEFDGRSNSVPVRAQGYFDERAHATTDGSPVTVKLFRHKGVAGVVRTTTGAPVPRASVTLANGWDLGAHTHESTDAAGRFEYRTIREGKVRICVQPTAESPNFLPEIFESAAGTTDLELVVKPALTISGRVVDDQGKPVRRIYVGRQVTDPVAQACAVLFTPVTDDDGRFVVPGLGPGRYALSIYDMRNEAGGYLPELVKDVEAGARDVVVTVRFGLTISGRVVDENGRPFLSKLVIAEDASTKPVLDGWGSGAEVDSEGRFVVRALKPGRYRLCLGATTNDPRRWSLEGGESVEAGAKDLTLKVLSGGSIAGIVVDAAGAPVPGAWVTAVWNADDPGGRNMQSDEQGRFEFVGLPPHAGYVLKAQGAIVRDVALGTRDVRLEVRPTQR